MFAMGSMGSSLGPPEMPWGPPQDPRHEVVTGGRVRRYRAVEKAQNEDWKEDEEEVSHDLLTRVK